MEEKSFQLSDSSQNIVENLATLLAERDRADDLESQD